MVAYFIAGLICKPKLNFLIFGFYILTKSLLSVYCCLKYPYGKKPKAHNLFCFL
jgi:hypothetical protein